MPNYLQYLREMTEILEKSNAFKRFDLAPQEFTINIRKNHMANFIFKDEGDNLSNLMDVAQSVPNPSNSNDPASTITSDNGEVINLGSEPTHTK